MKNYNYFTEQNTNGCYSAEQLSEMNAAFDVEMEGYSEEDQFWDSVAKNIADRIINKTATNSEVK